MGANITIAFIILKIYNKVTTYRFLLLFCDPKPEEMMIYNTVTFLPIKCISDRNL